MTSLRKVVDIGQKWGKKILCGSKKKVYIGQKWEKNIVQKWKQIDIGRKWEQITLEQIDIWRGSGKNINIGLKWEKTALVLWKILKIIIPKETVTKDQYHIIACHLVCVITFILHIQLVIACFYPSTICFHIEKLSHTFSFGYLSVTFDTLTLNLQTTSIFKWPWHSKVLNIQTTLTLTFKQLWPKFFY